MPPRRDERHENDPERHGLLVVPSLQEGRDDADEQGDDGQVVRRVEAAAQAVREDEERRAREARDEVRRLDHRERDQVADEVQSQAHLRRRTGEKQDHSANEGREREQRRRRDRRPSAGNARHASHARPAARGLVDRQQHEREPERKQVVDDAKDDHRAEQPGRLDVPAEQRDEGELEHPQPAGDVAHQSRNLREHERAEHHPERQVRRWKRQDGPEDRRHQHPVHERDGQLDERHPA